MYEALVILGIVLAGWPLVTAVVLLIIWTFRE